LPLGRNQLIRHQIDLLIPTCEEVFYVGQFAEELSQYATIFCEPLSELNRWHHKGMFQRYAAQLGLNTPRSIEISSHTELLAALPQFRQFALKPVYSRFAVSVITHQQAALHQCQASPQQPWLIQDFIEGQAECSYSIVHQGRITAHAAYRTLATVQQGAGSSFTAIDPHETYVIAQTLCQNGYTGQLSLDFIRSKHDQQLYLLECNPRSTSAVHLIEHQALEQAIVTPSDQVWLQGANISRQIAGVALPSALSGIAKQAWSLQAWHNLIKHLGIRDVIWQQNDILPSIAQFTTLMHFARIARRNKLGLTAATTHDIEWNGYADN
jgi:glutathione synthase/RimK-type ligase-like ATP-grasp enzyme